MTMQNTVTSAVRDWSGMSDLIDRQAAIDAIKKISSAKSVRTAKVISDDVIIVINGYRYHYEEYLCNACKKKVFSRDSYCSNCGAKLDRSWNE